MAGMQRFVTYIYAYDDGQKSSNSGYAKIEIRGNAGRIEIHFMNGGIADGMGKAAFLYTENEKFIYVPLGEFRVENDGGMRSFQFQTEKILNTELDFAKMDGIYITDSNNRMYLSFWKDTEAADFREINFVEYNLNMSSPETSAEPETLIRQETLTGQETITEPEPLQQTTEQSKKEIFEDAEQESLHTMEIPMRNFFPTYTMEDIWKNMAKNRTCVQINEKVCAIQIELSDLRELPKKYWYLGNNSFLLHGFFNYRHLLVGKLPDGTWFLGVPGIYERQERVMASIFGFPGFLPACEMPGTDRQPGNQPPEENSREMQQGIWYHILED